MKNFRLGLLACAGALVFAPESFAQSTTGASLVGAIDHVSLDDPLDPWSGGQMVVGGQVVVLPRNLLLDLPANRMSLQQLYATAPPAALAMGETGLALMDKSISVCSSGPAIATVIGNRTPAGNLIAGEVFIAKGSELVNGVVTFIDHDAGFLRIDGITADPATGLMIRINDPTSRYTIQSGPGCDGGPNCSPDERFGVDPDNYTITFTTGYPAGLPSTVPLGSRPGFEAGDDPAAASDANGVGDPLCPATNRSIAPVPDSTKFAPIQVGDSITAEGNMEFIGDVRFMSCHTLTVNSSLITRNEPTQPDYMTLAAGWHPAGFRTFGLGADFEGATTLSDSQLDVFALYLDPLTNANNEVPIGSTVGNPGTINQGLPPTAGHLYFVYYEFSSLAAVDSRLSPCQNLINAGFPEMCPSGGTLLEEFAAITPLTREVIGRTRHKLTLNPGVITRDVNGLEAPNGEYLTPVAIEHPIFAALGVDAAPAPYIFASLPWNLDRRLSPAGCDSVCEAGPQALDPFPFSELDPTTQGSVPPGGEDLTFGYWPFGPTDFLSWPPPAPPALPIEPTPAPDGTSPSAVVADFSRFPASGNPGTLFSFTDLSSNATSWIWDFGDGTTSNQQNPAHSYSQPGVYTIVQIATGPGGSDTLARLGDVDVNEADVFAVDFSASITSGPAPLTVQFAPAFSGGAADRSVWSFGDGRRSNLTNPAYTYTTPGTYTVILTARSTEGEVLSQEKVGFITVQ